MSKTLNTVIRFQGSELTWKNNIINGTWVDDIVFGLITDSNTGKTSKRIYAGRNSRNTDYEYKTSISVNSLAEANTLVLDDNIGLLITVISELNTNENGTYIVTYNAENILVLQKIGEQPIPVDASTIYTLIDASNKIMPDDPSSLLAIDRSAEGVKVKVTESGDEQTLKFGIDLDKIYLPHGIQRTEAIGVAPASDEIVTDGVGMSVKELLEFYLLKEKFPTVTTAKGGGKFTDFGLTVSGMPNTNVKNYIKINDSTAPNSGSLVEIGSTMSISEISGTLVCSRYGMQDSVTSTVSKINGLNFGYSTEKGNPTPDGHFEPAGIVSTDTIINGEPGIATATYTIKDSDLNVVSTLSVKGSITSSSTFDSTYLLSSQSVVVSQGDNHVSLSLNHNASATRTLENTLIPGIDQIYIISNKSHVCDGSVASVASSHISGSGSGAVNTYTTSTYKVIGVYPIFTNGAVTTLTGNLSGKCWYNEQYTEGPVNKLDLVNYLNANQTYLISFGSSAQHEKALMYVPHGMTFIVPEASEIDATMTITGWIDNNTRAQNWINDGSIYINIQGNNVVYDRYYDDTVSAGKCAFKIKINKK